MGREHSDRKAGIRLALRMLIALTISAASLPACRQAPAGSTATAAASRTPIRLGPTSTSAPATATSPAATETATLIPLEPIDSRDWQRGPASAAVTLLLYTDIHCQTCLQLHRDLQALMVRHPGNVRLVVRLFPLIDNRPLAGVAAEALLSANQMNLFWELFDFLNENSVEWVNLEHGEFIAWIVANSSDLGLNGEELQQDLEVGRFTDEVSRTYRTRLAQGIPGVPLLLINSDPFLITADPVSLEAAVRLAILSEMQFQSAPKDVIEAGQDYLADVEFDAGVVQIQLFAQESTMAVNSFVFLARQGWYDDTPISRSIPGVLVEAGDPTGTGLGNPGYFFPSESASSLSFDRAGIVGMSNSGPGTNGGRFFFALRAMSGLDDTHTVIGRVISGLDILTDLPPYDPLVDLLDEPPLRIRKVRIQEIE